MRVQLNIVNALFTHFWLLFCLCLVLEMVCIQFVCNTHPMDNTPGTFQAYAFNTASLYLYLISKAYILFSNKATF